MRGATKKLEGKHPVLKGPQRRKPKGGGGGEMEFRQSGHAGNAFHGCASAPDTLPAELSQRRLQHQASLEGPVQVKLSESRAAWRFLQKNPLGMLMFDALCSQLRRQDTPYSQPQEVG